MGVCQYSFEIYTSRFANVAFVEIKSLLDSVSVPIRSAVVLDASIASSISIFFKKRVSGFMVVSHNWSASISPTHKSNITIGADYFLSQTGN